MKKHKKYSNEELAEAYIFPHDLSPEEKAQSDKELVAFRMELLRNMSEEQKTYSSALQLIYIQLIYIQEDYTKGNNC